MSPKEVFAMAMIMNQLAIEEKDDPRVWRCVQQMDEAKQILEKQLKELQWQITQK